MSFDKRSLQNDSSDAAQMEHDLSAAQLRENRLKFLNSGALPMQALDLEPDKQDKTLTDISDKTKKTHRALGNVPETSSGAFASLSAGDGSHITGAVLAAFNFIRIPAVYFAARLAGEKPPVTLSKASQWAYSAGFLALTITALAVSAAATPIALTLAGAGFGMSVYNLAKVVNTRRKLRKSLHSLEHEIEREKMILNNLHVQAMRLEEEIALAQNANENEKVSNLKAQLAQVNKRFEALYDIKKEHLQLLHQKLDQHKEEYKKVDVSAAVDKAVALGISTLVLAGVALSLFFPPVGLGLLAAGIAAGGIYLLARKVFPFLSKKFFKKTTPKEESSPSPKDDNHARLRDEDQLKDIRSLTEKSSDRITLSHSQQNTNTSMETLPDSIAVAQKKTKLSAENDFHNSTIEMMEMLFGKETAKLDLEQQLADDQWFAKLHSKLNALVQQNNPEAMLKFFTQFSMHVQTCAGVCTADCVSKIFGKLKSLNPNISLEPVYKLMRTALSEVQSGKIKLSDQELNVLIGYPHLTEYLKKQNVHLNTLTPMPMISEESKAPTLRM